MEKIYKQFVVSESKAVDLDAGIFEAMITTEDIDRQGEIVRATGAKVENFLKNPVVLWAHAYDQLPVARALGIEIQPGKGLRAQFQFPEWGASEQADTVRRLWAGGFLNATSIGFIPLTWKAMEGEGREDELFFGPKEYTSWELLEFSIVPVPANQEALRLAYKMANEKWQVANEKWQAKAPDMGQMREHLDGMDDDMGSMREHMDAMRGMMGEEDEARGLGRLQTKRGRVLSAKNESRIRQAQGLLGEVLESLGTQPEEEEGDKGIGDKGQEDSRDEDPVIEQAGSDGAEPITDDGQDTNDLLLDASDAAVATLTESIRKLAESIQTR